MNKALFYLILFSLGSLFLSALLIWYDHLWLPRHHFAWLSQHLPLAGGIYLYVTALEGSWARWILGGPLGALFVCSVVLQLLLWLNIAHLPLY